MSETTETIRWERDAEGVVVLTLDDPNQSANTMNEDYIASMGRAVERLESERDEITGVVLASAKKTFFAGGDLNDLLVVRPEDAAEFAAMSERVKDQLRRLETLAKPVVAAINGAALGGGLEICLACHRRVAVDSPAVRLGFPEVTLGLLPGAGGVVRSVRMLGIADALTKLLLQGQRLRAQQALELGIVDELVAEPGELLGAAKAWIAANPEAAQPWDREGYRMPGGSPADPKLAANLPAFPANLRKQLKGASYPAPANILAAAVEGAQVDFDGALAIEGRYFVDLATGQIAKNMIQAFFFDMQKVSGDRGRPAEVERSQVRKVVVLGAGMMGAAIAYVCAKAGIEVVLKDVEQAGAERGKAYSERLVAKAVERGRSSEESGRALLERITPTADPADAAGADLMIEAVFEDPGLKARVFAEIEPQLAPDALLGSNTSTLPITGLAEHVSRPADFIGLHFFSPVDKMPLLEIIKGERTDEGALYRALDFAKQISKTPIVVNDSRGFFTSRVIATFINEGIAMLAEGIPAASIEQASMQAGYPAPVLQLADEINLKLMRLVRQAGIDAVEAAGGSWQPHPSEAVVDRMLDEFERPGRLEGAGFYEYEEGRRLRLWPGLVEGFGPDPEKAPPLQDLVERMLFIESLETVRCVEEGVIESVADANVGSILGIGFPGWTGGVLQYVNGYDGGPAGFLARARQLAERYGERFEPPELLVRMAADGERFEDREPAASGA
ncbi:MAG TPA: 3-hydroxyacyl-CoA dehydrogenase NAD-binding domain-containing protein [Solirubrobacterales bacterium]|jgi:3-hydroxyacyl-CoA dehydrogenase/enoyl-CoA hydratase/3-hydroxybutyryl-CoA epimerase